MKLRDPYFLISFESLKDIGGENRSKPENKS